MRLICLASLISGGIKPKVLENLEREVLQLYGCDWLRLLLNMGSPPCSLLIPSSGAPVPNIAYTQLRQRHRLVVEESDPVAAAGEPGGERERAEDLDLSYTMRR